MKKFISKVWWCYLWRFHNWTSPIEERGGKPDAKKVEQDGIVKSFLDDTMMYCKRCGRVSEVAIDFRKKMDKITLK